MNFLQKTARKMFGAYAATETSPHRRSPTRILKTTDDLLNRERRKKGNATLREEESNCSLLGWIVRKHLDYVSRFEINYRSGNANLDGEVKGLLDWHSRKRNFDYRSRLSRNQWMAIFERNKAMFGDAFGIMLASGRLQGVDSPQIGKPQYFETENSLTPREQDRINQHGLVVSDGGIIEAYCVCYRDKHGKLIFDHLEEPGNVLHDGYWTEFNQLRAPSPLLPALADVIDLSDIKLLAKVNLKLKNVFGMAILRGDSGELGMAGGQEDESTGEITGASLVPGQVNILDLDQADKVQMLESNTPGQNSMEFMKSLTQAVMLALDIPFTSYDSSRASFSARIGDRAEYEESAEGKREKNAAILREIYAWRISDWYNSNDQFRQAADAAGKLPGQIVAGLDIIPAGTPWLDKLNEVKGDILSVALGLESIPRLARKRGLDAYSVGKEQAEYLEWAKANGLPVFYASGGQEAVQNMLDEETQQGEEDNED